jgi:OmcA/MtrC family decaheme c-type cytochrome
VKNLDAAGHSPSLPRQPRLSRLVAAAAFAAVAVLAGCGGGSTGPAGPPGANGTNGTNGTNGQNSSATVNLGSNSATPSAANTAAWAALAPQVTITSVSIASPPVVNFKVTDASGNPVIGLGSTSQSSTATVASLTNVAFTLSKLVPGTSTTVNGTAFSAEPSKWVNYLVTKPLTVAQAGGTIAASDSCNLTVTPKVCGRYPGTDVEGTLVDNGDGTYQYTFYRDITQAATVVAGLTDSADGLSKKADLGDLSYDPTLTHRLGVIISGSAPGTGTNTPNAVQAVTPVPMVKTYNLGYDFVPNGGTPTVTRDIVVKASCTSCHDGRGIGHISTFNGTNGVPAGSYVGRNDPRLCVTCHTDQIRYSFDAGNAPMNADGITFTVQSGTNAVVRPAQAILGGRAVGNYPNLIHKTHMGQELVLQGYNFNNNGGAQMFNTVRLPQDPKNCTTCHTGTAIAGTALAKGNQNVTADGDNWKNNPSMLACGACHDGINFTTGTGITLADAAKDTANNVPVGTTQTGHVGGAQADNGRCVLCHTNATIPVYHETNFSTPANATAAASISTFAYKISSVTVNGSGNPVITFQITKDGAVVNSLPVPTLVTNASSGAQVVSPTYEPIPGFAGGPSLYVLYSVPEDNIAAPADFNKSASASLTNLLITSGSPQAGSLSNTLSAGAYQADANGYFTATITGDTLGQPVGAGCTRPVAPATATCVNTLVAVAPIVVPASAKMVTGMILGGFTQKTATGYPYTAANVSVNPTTAASGGIAAVAEIAKVVATGYTARRVVVDTAKCDTCHDQLGTSPNFHGGVRNDATACAGCHTTNGVDNGWSYNASTFIHGIHGASQRTVPYTWQASASWNYSKLLYPGLLKDCSQCHVPNAVNFGPSGMTLAPNLLWTTDATGITAAPTVGTSPYVSQVAGTNYGLGFSFTSAGATVASYTLYNNGTPITVPAHVAAAGGDTRQAEGTTLVSSPIAAACFACHDTTSDKNHMTTNGGVIYQPRSTTALTSNVTGEACLVCHGQGQIEDVAAVHLSGGP